MLNLLSTYDGSFLLLVWLKNMLEDWNGSVQFMGFYSYAIKKDWSYVYATKKMRDTCVPSILSFVYPCAISDGWRLNHA